MPAPASWTPASWHDYRAERRLSDRALANLGDVAEIELRLSGPIAPDAGNRNPGAFKPGRSVSARLLQSVRSP
jgi:hypothetical protein